MVGVFALNLYIGLDDRVLAETNLVHYYFNWIIVAVDLISAIFLFVKPKSQQWIALSGIIWPIAYLLSLAADVATSLCFGTPASSSCLPTPSDAFRYLIMGDPLEGWALWPFTIPSAILLLIAVIIISTISIIKLQKDKSSKTPLNQEPSPKDKDVASHNGMSSAIYCQEWQ